MTLAALNATLDSHARAISKELASAPGLLHVLERDFGFTRPQFAKMAGGRPGADPNNEITLTAAMAAWCLAGPELVGIKTANHHPWRTLPLPGIPSSSLTPGSDLILIGCGFGTAPGTVKMTLDATGQSFDLSLAVDRSDTPWEKFQVWVQAPQIAGVPDQTATLTLTDNANRATTLKVPFVAARARQIFDGFAHSDLISVNPECFTAATDDSCGSAPPGDSRWPEGRTFVGVHWKACCRSVDGLDVYSFKLKNGWTAAGLDPYANKEPGSFRSLSSVERDEHAGLTTCWWFGNKPGWAAFDGAWPSSSPDVTFQAQFIWHLDSVCSAAHYAANMVIVGPDSMPYW